MTSGPLRNVVDGKPADPSSDDLIEVIDPSTEATIAEFAASSAADVDAAVAAARRACEQWGGRTPGERSKLLDELGDHVAAHADELIDLEVRDAGKPVTTVRRDEMPGILESFRFFASAGRLAHGPAAADYVEGHTALFRREPMGVVAGITPWNFPLWQAVWKAVPAMAAGNAVVLKPAENTPLSTTRFAELAAQVLPPGVLNLVNGRGEGTGSALVAHPGVDMVSFTGSTRAGRSIASSAGRGVKPLLLELGGNAPVIIFDDVDVDAALDTWTNGILFNAGQECMSATRLLIQAGVYQEVVDRLIERVTATARIGPASDPDTTLGPVISQVQLDRLERLVGARAGETEILLGGQRADRPGYFYPPTLVAGVSQRDELVQEEIFGPVATVQRFGAEGEALSLANDVEQGLAASVWTRDVARALRCANRLDFGNVWINTHMVVGPEVPLGGFRGSGYGKEGGQAGVDAFTRVKHIQIGLR